jgi:hypothetical protein
MAATWPVQSRYVRNLATLTQLQNGTGASGIVLLSAASVVLGTVVIDTATSSASSVTAALTLVPVAGAVGVAAGVAATAKIVARDGTTVIDTVPVATGTTPVTGSVVLDSTTVEVGGAITITSAVIA